MIMFKSVLIDRVSQYTLSPLGPFCPGEPASPAVPCGPGSPAGPGEPPGPLSPLKENSMIYSQTLILPG